MDRSRLLRVFGAVVLVGTSVGMLVAVFDVREAVQIIQQARLDLFVVAVVLFYGTFAFRGERWHRMLQGAGIETDRRDSWEVLFLSFYANNIVPGQLGDLYRGHLLGERGTFAKSRVIGTVVADRLLDLGVIVLGFLFTGGLLYAGAMQSVVGTMLTGQQLIVLIVLLLVGAVAVYAVAHMERFDMYLSRFSEGFRTSITRENGFPIIILTLLLWGAVIARVWIVLLAVGMTQSPIFAGFLGFTMLLLSMTPLTPAGLGVVEVITTAGFALAGVNAEMVLAAILLDRSITYASLLVTGAGLATITGRDLF